MTKKTEVATLDVAVPAYLQASANLGNQEVRAEDLEIPRISLVQQSSKCIDPNHKSYVEGVKVGQFLNSTTGDFYDELLCVNLKFETRYVVWKGQEAGGGKFGEFGSRHEAMENIAADQFMSEIAKESCRIDETHRHLLWIINSETNELDQIPYILDFANSKMRVSRSWNSNIALKQYDRFSHVWKLTSTSESKGSNSWVNIGIEPVGYAPENVYSQAKEYYQKHLASDTQQEASVAH